ncbi:uncharacterized protein [Sinocyclocheilus grahami]|uniref:uncharacterized protein n=1 Tax=Sinocyclocheilus grahami TaxID=75366 RepID=UPI0007AD2C09|nr:PREDICTED: uncharacterized protein LOC107584415 [Sinocyclocheilus grahami]
MSGRKSKKNQRLGSSRRGPKGLNRNTEKDDDDDDGFQQTAESEDGRDEFHTTSDYHATQFDHPPSSSIEQQTSALECPPHARGHKDSLMETELPERKRKMGSTRKSTGRFKGERKLDDVRTTEELDEEYVTQPNTSTTEEQHASLTKEEQSSFPSDLSLQTKSSGFGKESGTTPVFAVSENKGKGTIHHQEITFHSHEVVSEMPIDEAMGPSVHSIPVTVAERDLLREDSVMFNEPKTLSHQETQIASTSGQKRRMGSTRRPLGGQNSEIVGVQEHSRNMTENERKAKVMGEAKLKMSEEMAQTWDDVARVDPSSHTESALLLSQSLLADRAELKESDVSAGTETMNQSVAFPLVDSEKPLPETSSHHGTPLLNEAMDFKFGSHTEDLDVLNKVLKEAGSHLSDNSQHVSDTRKDTNPSYDFSDVNTESKKEVLKQKEEPQLEELELHDQESSLSQHDIATLNNNYDCSMVQHIMGGSRSFDMPMSNISHAEPTMTNLPHEMRDAVEERQEINIEMKQENNVCDVASVKCDGLTNLVSITEEDEDPHILATRENENMSVERVYAFEMTDQGDVRDHNVKQIIMDVRDHEKDGETSTETIWISHKKPCDVSNENKELYKGQEHHSSNISLTHSQTHDDAGKMLENEEVRKDKKETENTAVDDVTSKSEEMFSFEDSATDTGSHAQQQLFMQSPDKEDYDLHENVNEKHEKEEILFSVESENVAFDRGNERSEGTDRIKEMDAAPVLTLDVGDADLRLEVEAQNKTFDSTNSEAGGTEENINGASVLVRENKVIGNTVESNMTPDAHMESLKVSENAEQEVSGETILKQSDINIVPDDSHEEKAHAKSSPVIQKRKMGSTRRPLRGNKGLRKGHDEKEIFNLEDEPSPDESRYTAVSICDISESQTFSKIYAGSQENTGDVEIVPAEGDTESHSEIKTFDSTAFGEVEVREVDVIGGTVGSNMTTESDFHQTSDANMETLKVSENPDSEDLELRSSQSEIQPENKMIELTSEAERTEDTICEASVLVREDEFIGDTVTVESNMTTESDFLQTSPDAHMEALKVSKNAEREVSGETNTILEQSDISIIPADFHREETHSKSSPVIQKRKMGSTRRPLKGNKGLRKGHNEKEIFNLEDEPSPDESRYTAVSICDISESQTCTKIHAGSQENTGDVEGVPAEGDTESHSENKTIYSPAFEGETTGENICAASALDRNVEFIGDAVIVESNMTTESDIVQNDTSTDAQLETLVSENAENEMSGKTDIISKQSVPNIIPEDLHGEEVHTKLNLNVHKRKMGSTRRPLRGNKGQRKVRVESKENNGDSEGVSEEEDTETHSEIQNWDNVVDQNVTQEIMNVRDVEDEERKTTKTLDMSVQVLCDDLELEQRSDASQTQTGPSQEDTGSYFPERTADIVRDSNSLSDMVMSDALLMEETQIHVSSNDVPPTEVVEMNPVSKKSMQKRKMGSTRKRGKRMVNDKEVEEEKEGETENTTADDETTESEEKLTLEEAITGSPVHQQLFSSSADKEDHDIQDIVCKSYVQAENSEQNDQNSTINPELLIESECSSNVAAEMVSDLPLGDVDTYLDPKQSVIPKESHREVQPNLNPVVQKRKMGSTRKTLNGNKGQGRIAESKKMDGNSEGMIQEQDTEPHLETSARKTEFDEAVEQNFPFECSHPVASSNMLLEPENGVTEVSQNIHDLSEVSEEKGMDNTGNDSNSLSEAINLKEGTKVKFVLTISHEDVHQIVSEPEQTENTHKVIPTQELRATLDDVIHENNSRKIPATQEKRRKMGSTRRNSRAMHGKNIADNEDVLGVAEDRETKKAEDDLEEALSISQSKDVSSVSTTDLNSEMLASVTDLKVDHLHSFRPTVPETHENTLQICDNQLENADVTKHPQSETVTIEKRKKMGSTRKNLRKGGIRGKRDGYEDTEIEDTNVQMSQDSEMSLVREDVRQQSTHDYSSQPEDSLLSEIERALNKTSQSSLSCDWELIVKEPNPDDLANAPDLNMPENSEIKSLQPMPSAHSEPNSPGGRRRKMGSTHKNLRQQLKAEREDEDKEDGEIDENSKTNKQEKKDLERVEVSVVHNITENKLNKEYLDVSSAHTSSNQLEESTNPVSQEKTSPSTKRKFGSRRANKGKQGLGRLADSDFGNDLEDGDHKPDSSEVKDKLHSDDLAVCDPCLTLQPENQPASEQRNMEAKNEEAAPKGTGAGLVSLDQIIKHDSTGAKQTVNLKNRISDTEVVQFNVVMVGNSCVGKTSFIRRFHEDQFTEDYRSTIGVDTCIQTVVLPDRTVRLQIWDTAGQERFHSITTQVFHKADGLLLMYEVTCSKSFISVRDWISQAQQRAPNDVIMMLLGNKNDSVKREVQVQEGADLAREYNIHFMECSAATGVNVSESMRTLAEMLVQRKSQKEKHTTLRREPPQKKSGCC